jgi:hypothetical protein
MVELKYKYNDGGRSKYFNTINGDCVARAIAIVLDRDYMEVYKLLKKYRKRPSYGIPTHLIPAIMSEFGFEYVQFDTPKYFCAEIIPMNERIITDSNTHFSAVINGEVNDTFKAHYVFDCNLINGYYKLKTEK